MSNKKVCQEFYGSKWKLLPISWKHQTKEFFEKSTLHGVRYIAESGRPFYERFMWFTLTTLGTVTALMIIFSLWEKFQSNPTITGLDTDFHNWDVPFPAITLCPSNSVNETQLDEYVRKQWGEDLPEEKMNYYKEYIAQIVLLSYNNFQNIDKFVGDKSLPQDNFKQILSEVRISCDDLAYDCEWKDMEFSCCDAFLPIRTENGFCYSFNSQQAQLEAYTDLKKVSDESVQYIYETDSTWSLVFSLRTKNDNHVKIFIHSWEETPNLDMDPQLVWMHQICRVFFSSKHTYTTDDARQLSAKQRRCIFHDEIKLLTHPRYSYSACMTQCRMETARKLCGCVPNFYKEIEGFTLCNLTGLGCISVHLSNLGRGLNCPCELGCENTVYEVEKLVDSVEADEPLHVGFGSWPMVRYKREVLFGWVDLLVSFGGIAGLFLGFSLLTAVEIIYYFTMRALCMVHHNSDELMQIYNEGNSDTRQPEFNQQKPKIKKKKLSAINKKNDEIYTIPFLN
ncbi:sodium channel protein Nach-like [Lycorma delicatula]|uniref:sodium channel protein Nach-like n=1 Tax=Lycorma delicatula TaxID=130591 RepID=UPI003F513086